MRLMKRPWQIVRLFQIYFIIFSNRLDTIVLSTQALQSFSFLSYFNPWNWLRRESRPRGEAIRVALEQLGPVFVKFGQVLSTRRDLLPEDIADELEKLQDQVPPFPGSTAKEILENQYKKPISTVFASFDLTPMASASIAQVHAAKLTNGKSVAIKIVRPNIQRTISRDIGLLYMVASLAETFLPHGKKLRPKQVVAEVERSILYELDLTHEGANASQLRRNFHDSPLLYIPEVHWDYTSSKILVMERIMGIPISDTTTLQAHHVDLKRLAEKGVEIFFTQVLRDSFFHADMHPGNIFVNADEPADPKYIAIDFGIMGTLSPIDQRYLAENLLAFFRRDYRRVAELHIESGWVGSTVRVDEFETAIRGVCEPIFERPLKDISFGRLLLKVFQAAREFNMEVQPQFFLLQKTLLNIEGLGRALYPDLDLWTTAKPYIEKWIKQEMGPKALAKRIYHQAPLWLDKLFDMPDLCHKALVLQTKVYQQQISEQNKESTAKMLTRRRWQGLGFGLIIMAIFNSIFTMQHKQYILTIAIGLVGAILFFINL